LGRHTRDKVLRIRFRDNIGIKSTLTIRDDHKAVRDTFNNKGGGRILKIGKVSYEELFHVGSGNHDIERWREENCNKGYQEPIQIQKEVA
jgi:hypothetical protein